MLLIKLTKSHTDIPLSLKMNVANFKPGQVEPGEKIVLALNGKFNIIDGELNLENFAANEGMFFFNVLYIDTFLILTH